LSGYRYPENFFLIEIENGFQLGYYCLVEDRRIGDKVLMAENTILTNLPIGREARVTAVKGEGRVTRRLMEMGVIPGVAVQVVKMAPFGDPIEVRLRGYSLAMRRTEADAIEVSF